MSELMPGSGPRIDVRDLGQLLKRRRAAQGVTLRQVEEAMDHALAASTLSRLENGATPDPMNVAHLAAWLEVPLDLISWPGETAASSTPLSTPELVELHLRADRSLKPEVAEVLAMVFRRLYDDLASGVVPLASGKEL